MRKVTKERINKLEETASDLENQINHLHSLLEESGIIHRVRTVVQYHRMHSFYVVDVGVMKLKEDFLLLLRHLKLVKKTTKEKPATTKYIKKRRCL